MGHQLTVTLADLAPRTPAMGYGGSLETGSYSKEETWRGLSAPNNTSTEVPESVE